MKNHLELINATLCIASFVIYFIALCLDLMDKNNGSILRRITFVLLLLWNSSLIIRLNNPTVNSSVMAIWFFVSLMQGVAKWLQYKGRTKTVDAKISKMTHSFTKSRNGKEQVVHH